MSSLDAPHFSVTDVEVTFDAAIAPGWVGAALSAGAAAPGRIATVSSTSADATSMSIERRGIRRAALGMHVSSRAAWALPEQTSEPARTLSLGSQSVHGQESGFKPLTH